MFAAMVLISAVSWQGPVTKMINENPKLAGRVVEVCVDSECITIDRSNDAANRVKGEGDGGPAMVEPPDASAGSSVSGVVGSILQKVGGHGSVKVDFKETTKDKDGSEHTIEVHIEVKGGTGSGR